MGLDLVELLLSIEDEFGIHIDDDSLLETPAHVTDYLCSRLRMNFIEPCPSQVGFYQLRKAIVTVFSVERKSIRPHSLLSPLLTGNVKENWKILQKSVGVREFPRLKRSRFLLALVMVIPILTLALMLAASFPISLAMMLSLLLIIIADYATYEMGTDIPQQTSTVADLIPYVTCNKSFVWTRSEVLERVIQLTSEQLGIPKHQIHENSYFVKDLGAD